LIESVGCGDLRNKGIPEYCVCLRRKRKRLEMGLKQRFNIVLFGMIKAVGGLAILGLMSAAISQRANAQAVTATVAAGNGPSAVALNPNTNKIYVANENSDNAQPSTVTVIDGATNNATTVAVGVQPRAVAVNPVTNEIYVANCANGNPPGTVTVIDGATNNTTTVSVGSGPIAIAANSNTNQIYVANFSSNSVTVIDGATNNTTTIAGISAPSAIAVNPNTNQIYVVNANATQASTVTVIDGTTNNTTTVAVGNSPFAVAVNPVTNQIYVANGGTGGANPQPSSVTVIDGATNNTTTVAAYLVYSGGGPEAVAVNSVANQIYVSNGEGVTVIDGATNNTTTVTTTVAAGYGSAAVAVNPNTNQIYVVNQETENVTVIDGATNNTLPVAAGTQPLSLAVDSNTNQIYVTNFGSNNVTVIDGNAPWSADFVVFDGAGAGAGPTITAGQSGTVTIGVEPQGSFTNPISFSCSGLPALAGCTFSPASVTPNSSIVTTTLTITTGAPTASLAPPFGRRSSPLYAIWLVLPAMLLGTVGLAAPKRRQLLSYCIVFLLVSGCLLQVACNGASNSGSGGVGGGGTGGTPAGTYTVTVTGTAGATQHTTPVTLTVQ
jgi:YVTN family beta-propeller protein